MKDSLARTVGTLTLAEREELLAEVERLARIGAQLWIPGEHVVWSDNYFRLLGHEPGDEVHAAETFVARIHPDDRARVLAAWGRFEASGTQETLDFRLVRPDGSVRWVRGTGAATVEDGRLVRYVGAVIDVTDRVELEDQLRHAAKLEAIGTLAAGVAHDVNNYLTVMTAAVELIGSDRRAAEDSAEVIRHAIKQCTLLTRQLLAFARRQPYAPRTIELVELTRGVARLLARILDERIELIVDAGDPALWVDADPGHLEHVIVNLVANARDAMPTGGRLTLALASVTLAPGERGPVGVPPGRWVRLDVADTGSGIAPEVLTHLFEPYFTTKAPGQGTGLGLASVYGTVRQNHGHVTVASAPGHGTTFSVFLPLREAPAPALAAAPARPPGGEGTLLVVEDMPELRQLIARVAEAVGYRVILVANGADALAVLDGGAQVDVVLSDVVMPHLGGLELATSLAEQRPELPLVLMTGYAEQAALAASHRVVIAKPFAVDDLLTALARARGR